MKDFLAERHANRPRELAYYTSLWDAHLASGLANTHFISELMSGSDAKFFQRVWEMLLGQHLIACGYNITSGPEGEPDFRFQHEGVVVWVEAISPEGGPDLSRDPPTTGATVPQGEMLLRWTTALDAKWKKGCEYRRKGVVKPEDAYVIAIDGSQLGWFPLPHGQSRAPYVVEATLAMGSLAFKFDTTTGALAGTTPTVRLAIINRNDAPVRTEPFFNDDYSSVSAAIGCVPPPLFSKSNLPIQIAHNPLADVPLKPGLFGQDADEWVAELVGDDAEGRDWDIRQLTPIA